ncbi:MAG: hypothetical protein ACYTG0_18095, partial [Planctomycetota bacterium]
DVKILIEWIHEYVEGKGMEFLPTLPESQRELLVKKLADAEEGSRSRREIFGWLWLRRELDEADTPPPPNEDDLKELGSRLSAATRDALDEVPFDERRQAIDTLIRMVVLGRYAYWSGNLPEWMISDEEVRAYAERFVEELDTNVRERIMSFPAEMQRRALLAGYLRERWPGLWPDPWRGRGGPFGPRRGGLGRSGRGLRSGSGDRGKPGPKAAGLPPPP